MVRNIFLSLIFMVSISHANGVAIVDASVPSYLTLVSSTVDVTIENQVAITKTTQTFLNNFGEEKKFKYAFPLNEQASAIGMRWKLNNKWFSASFTTSPQDTSLPGSGNEMDAFLENYLGETPLYFELPEALAKDSIIVFELTYVELLPYEFGNVVYSYPNDYRDIQNTLLNLQQINLTINSERNIDSLKIIELENAVITNDGNTATLLWQNFEAVASHNYEIQYSLNLQELGLFDLSTFLPDSLVPDSQESGFFLFAVEPDPSENTDVIDKVFTLIIDRSGSMEWERRLIQAKEASSFIVQNLNEGDKFNIVDFSGGATSFRESHVIYNQENMNAALVYINNLEPTWSGNAGTNIAGAFDVAIPQFGIVNDSTANIIIFFTDGEPTVGLLETDEIVDHVNSLVLQNETRLSIFTFGVGTNINYQLLTLLASQNNGISLFIGNDEVEEYISNFYLTIRNPVLLNTKMTFSSDAIVDYYPSPLPDLYKGQQLIISGRYAKSAQTTVTLSGDAFGQPLEYTYDLSLTDSSVGRYQFLPKIWAKKKIEYLLIKYYSLDENSAEAGGVKEEIISLSMSFGVLTPFTSFSYDPTRIEEIQQDIPNQVVKSFILLGNYPNPFNPTTTIKFQVNRPKNGIAKIKIYNSTGELVRVLYSSINGIGEYEVFWDGKSTNRNFVSTGTYFYVIDFDNSLLVGKMTLIK